MVINAMLMLLSLDMFLQCFFQRCFTLGDTLNHLRHESKCPYTLQHAPVRQEKLSISNLPSASLSSFAGLSVLRGCFRLLGFVVSAQILIYAPNPPQSTNTRRTLPQSRGYAASFHRPQLISSCSARF
jgi:hypothetical protein